jgi:hypothetical protein
MEEGVQATLTEVIVGDDPPPPPPPPLLEPPPQPAINVKSTGIMANWMNRPKVLLKPQLRTQATMATSLQQEQTGQDSLVHSSAPAVTSPLKRKEPDLAQKSLVI